LKTLCGIDTSWLRAHPEAPRLEDAGIQIVPEPRDTDIWHDVAALLRMRQATEPEFACALAASGVEADFAFVPHSGPYARGIHMTVQGSLKSSKDTSQVLGALREFYAGCPFIRVTDAAPRVKNVATSNYAHLSAATNGSSIAVMSVLDNLNKGAAGGGVQWMNRLLGFDETLGLTAPAAGWT